MVKYSSCIMQLHGGILQLYHVVRWCSCITKLDGEILQLYAVRWWNTSSLVNS